MFFPKAMSEIELIVPAKDLLRVTRVLSGRGVFHQVEAQPASTAHPDGGEANWPEKVATYAALERRAQRLVQNLGIDDSAGESADFQDVVDPEAAGATLYGVETDVK